MKKKIEGLKESNFGSILEAEIKKKFKNQSVFAEEIGVTQATVSRYISGNALPSFQILRKMSDTLNVDLGVLNNAPQQKPVLDGIVSVPFFYSEVSAGRGIEAISSASENLYFDESFLKNQFLIKNIKDIFAVRVKGDSMETLISEGDIVFAQSIALDSPSQGIYIVSYNQEYFIKKIQSKSKDEIKLISANPDYDPIVVNLQDENTEFKILAKVVGRMSIKNFTGYSLYD